jgi:hypothetical protein
MRGISIVAEGDVIDLPAMAPIRDGEFSGSAVERRIAYGI